MKLRIATCVVALALGASSASAQSIGIYADPAAANCNITLPPFTPTNWYIMATLGGAAAGGISGAEFRVENWPSGGFDTVTPNPGSNLALGNPIAAVNPGCNIAFPGCQPGTGGVVLLYTIQSLALSPIATRTIAVLKHTAPSNVNFQCPLVTLCDAPVFTKVCVNGGQAVINGTGGCTVAVEQKTWSNVKSLYNN